MEIYSIKINGKKIKQYNTYESALIEMDIIIKKYYNSTIEMFMEDFNNHDNLDTCCKIYLLCEYKHNIFKIISK